MSSEQQVRVKLDASRKELLDLGLRNPLLNYRTLRSRGVELVEELPPEVFRLLVREGKSMTFLPDKEEKEGEESVEQVEALPVELAGDRHLLANLPESEIEQVAAELRINLEPQYVAGVVGQP